MDRAGAGGSFLIAKDHAVDIVLGKARVAAEIDMCGERSDVGEALMRLGIGQGHGGACQRRIAENAGAFGQHTR